MSRPFLQGSKVSRARSMIRYDFTFTTVLLSLILIHKLTKYFFVLPYRIVQKDILE